MTHSEDQFAEAKGVGRMNIALDDLGPASRIGWSSDFDLQCFGKVLQIQDETENTGWAIIERPFHARIAHTLPGWAIHESMRPLTPGDTIPLRRDLE